MEQELSAHEQTDNLSGKLSCKNLDFTLIGQKIRVGFIIQPVGLKILFAVYCYAKRIAGIELLFIRISNKHFITNSKRRNYNGRKTIPRTYSKCKVKIIWQWPIYSTLGPRKELDNKWSIYLIISGYKKIIYYYNTPGRERERAKYVEDL